MENNWVWVEANKWCLFPPLPLNGDVTPYPNLKVWSDFYDLHPDYDKLEFLDNEYIFNPNEFADLSGGRWEVFRKNIRKWPKEHPKWTYCDDCDEEQVRKVLGNWLEEKMKTVLDADILVEFAFTSNLIGIYRKYLYDGEGTLVAINVWDQNWKYINFRYCIIDMSQPYLDEFARYLFYTDPDIQISGKLINDGGSLGNKGLEKFKDKLNPVRKREVYSWFNK
jgi:hypothetical protein